MNPKFKFVPEDISMVNYHLIKGEINSPEDFDVSKLNGHSIENTLELGFNFEEKLVRADFKIKITTRSKTNEDGVSNLEGIGSFHLSYAFKIDKIHDLATIQADNVVEVDDVFAVTIASIIYSTSRGVLLTRLQGTVLANFILPVIDPRKLLNLETLESDLTKI